MRSGTTTGAVHIVEYQHRSRGRRADRRKASMEATRNAGRSGARRGRIAVGFGLLAAMLVGSAGGSSGTTNAQDVRGPSSPAPLVDVAESAVDQAREVAESPSADGPERSRSLLLNRGAMKAVLSTAPNDADAPGSLTLELPAPDGTMMAFDVWENAVMAPELAARFPEIKTYSGQGIDHGAATIAFDLTPHGFHAQVLSPNGNWYIDPAIHLEDVFHESFYRADQDAGPAGAFVEENAAEIDELAAERPDAPVASRSGSELRTHRLAVSATSAYTGFFGGNQAGAFSAITTAITRVNGIYETELAISLQLVASEMGVIYESLAGGSCAGPSRNITNMVGGAGTTEITVTTNVSHGFATGDVVEIAGTSSMNATWAVRSITGATQFVVRGSTFSNGSNFGTVREWDPTAGNDCDPFNNTTSDINVNQAVVDQVIGDANYDIGHVFTTTSGGVAGLGVVGVTNQKARGLTGLPSLAELTSDEFFVDFVAHEMGHQYGGDHTFNGDRGNCSGPNWGGAADSYEPGSGSTIQAYAGICGDDNLQVAGQGQSSNDGTNASDPYFHSHSFDQIIDHVATIPSAGTTTATGNNVPDVSPGPDITIPAQTPFFLGATGTDADGGDVLTYNFEQRDQGAHSVLDAPEINTIGPLFRSFQPTINDTSFFPRLSDLADGSTNQNASCPTLTGSDKNAADCWSQFLIQTSGVNSIALNTERMMNFRATVRDNRAGGGGVNYDDDDMQVTVRNTGTKFNVTAPNGGETIAGATTVTWDVAGTVAAPISAATVSIRLSTDGGPTFPTVLATDVPNDGSESVVMPNAAHGQARVMVHSGTYDGGSGFFDISNSNFTTSVYALSPPSAPINPQRTPFDSQVTVMWSPPSSDGGSPITGYDVTASPGGATCGTGGALNCTVLGLTNGVSYTFAVTATNVIGTGPAANTPPVVPKSPRFTPVRQQRLEDTRPTKYGNAAGTAAPFTFNVYDYPGILPTSGIDAVSLNITVDQGEQPTLGGGYATLWDCTGSRPTASNLNFHTPLPVPNAAITPVSPTGDVCIYVYGKAALLVDINGYFPDGSDFTSVPQRRLEDTRPTKYGNAAGTAAPFTFNVYDYPGILPTSGIDAVSLNITVDQGEQPTLGGGYATLWDCTGSRPTASNLNFHTPLPVPNAAITPVSPTGDVCIYVYGKAALLVDINGYFPA